MALDLIGSRLGADVLDIHAGGVDLIFPHHEDEIAQSCAFTGQADFARYWLHGEFLNVRGTKMSKRFGNITTPRDLRQDGVDAGALRLLVFQTHYRQKLDLTDDALAAAREGARRLGDFAHRLRDGMAPEDGVDFRTAAERLSRDFEAALDDDLNAPRAVAALFDFVTEGNRLLDAGERPGPAAGGAWARADSVLDAATAPRFVTAPMPGPQAQPGQGPAAPEAIVETPPADPGLLDGWAGEWKRRRDAAKARRDYGEADRIRKLLQDNGFEIRDRKDGVTEVVRR
jgi:cysteinyl-tRNA synthetase